MSEALPIPAFDQKLKSSHYISGQGPKVMDFNSSVAQKYSKNISSDTVLY